MKHRLLYIPNEGFIGDQVAPRDAFEKLHKENILDDYRAFSFLVVAKELGSWDKMLTSLLEYAENYQPTLILWELQTYGRVKKNFVWKLRKLKSNPIITQRTGDSYWKPPRNMVEFGTEIDATFLTGTTLIPEFEKLGCRNVLYLGERLDTVRFGKPYAQNPNPEFDVIMIANFYNQWWFRKFPGQKDREELVKSFSAYFGKKFGLFGHGWRNNPCWQGVIPYSEQQVYMQNSRLILGVNNWHHNHYYSDRLLISLSSGVPVLYKYFNGADDYFKDKTHIWYFGNNSDALNTAVKILETPEEIINSICRNAFNLTVEEHSCIHRAKEFLELVERYINKREVL